MYRIYYTIYYIFYYNNIFYIKLFIDIMSRHNESKQFIAKIILQKDLIFKSVV